MKEKRIFYMAPQIAVTPIIRGSEANKILSESKHIL